jgi:hypothetical protein
LAIYAVLAIYPALAIDAVLAIRSVDTVHARLTGPPRRTRWPNGGLVVVDVVPQHAGGQMTALPVDELPLDAELVLATIRRGTNDPNGPRRGRDTTAEPLTCLPADAGVRPQQSEEQAEHGEGTQQASASPLVLIGFGATRVRLGRMREAHLSHI